MEIYFCDVCAILEKVKSKINQFDQITQKNAKKEHKRQLYRTAFQQILANLPPMEPDDLERMFRCLAPSKDSARKYSIQETTLSKLLLDAFGMRNTIQGQRLLNWKAGSIEYRTKGMGDFGTVVGQVFWHQKGVQHTLKKVCELLHELALTCPWSTVERDIVPREQTVIIRELFFNQEGTPCKWLARIILKNMVIPLEWQDFMYAFHPLMVPVYRVQSDLQKTCQTIVRMIRDGHDGPSFYQGNVFKLDHYLTVKKVHCTPICGTFISCMECVQAKSISDVYDQMCKQSHDYAENGIDPDANFFVELKYDGERMQIHIQDGVIQIFSKSGRNSTQDRVLAHDIILKSLKGVHNGILEAELLVFNQESNSIERFGGVQGFRFGKTHSDRNLYVVFYDVLYLNDQNFLYAPFRHRRAKLLEVVQSIPKYSQVSECMLFDIPAKSSWSMNTFAGLKSLFIETISLGKEGLIAKAASSFYRPGRRIDWIKIKPDYMRGLGDTGEYCLVGGSWIPSNTFLGLRLEDNPYLMNTFFVGVLLNKNAVKDGADDPCFRVMFTLSAGFSRDLLIDFCSELREKRKPYVMNDTSLSFRLEKDSGTPKMDYVFLSPRPVKLKGSSFEKRGNVGSWILRHPRLVEICSSDVQICDTISYRELQSLGAESESLDTQETKQLKDLLDDLDFQFLQKNLLVELNDSESLSETMSVVSEVENQLNPMKCWLYFHPPLEIRRDHILYSYVLNSPLALLIGCGWNCETSCQKDQHREGIFFVNPEGCENIITTLEAQCSAKCSFQKTIFIISSEWLEMNCSTISPEYHLAVISPFV